MIGFANEFPNIQNSNKRPTVKSVRISIKPKNMEMQFGSVDKLNAIRITMTVVMALC